MDKRGRDIIALLAGMVLTAVGLWLRFHFDRGLPGWIVYAGWALVFAGALLMVYGFCRHWLPATLAASKAPGVFLLIRAMICASVLITASGLYRMWRYEDELAHHAGESPGIITRHYSKGKSHVHYQCYRFRYQGDSYTGEFPDPRQRLQVGDTVRILHGTRHPEYNRALVDWIYEP